MVFAELQFLLLLLLLLLCDFLFIKFLGGKG